MLSMERDCSLSDITECPCCRENFTAPRILPCLHTLCLNCIERYGASGSVEPDLISCPVCAKQVKLPSTGLLRDLPRNQFMEKLVKIQRISKPSAFGDAACDVCRNDEEKPSVVKATAFCVNCSELMCDQCCAVHRRMTSCKSHRVVDIGGHLTAQDFVNCQASECDQHPEEPIKMYCQDCDKCICFLCYAELHNRHRCSDVNKVAQSFSDDIERDIDLATGILSEEFRDAEELEKRKDRFLAQMHQHEAAIQQKTTKLKFLIELHCNELLDNLNDIKEAGVKGYENAKNEMERCWAMTNSFRRYATEVKEKGTVSDVITAAHNLRARITELRQLHTRHHENQHAFDDVFFQPCNIQQLLIGEKINNMVGKVDSKPQAPAKACLPPVKGTTTYQITAKGSLIVRDCTEDGTCITIENTGTKGQYLGGWAIRRNIDGVDRCDYILSRDVVISPRAKVKLWAMGTKPVGDSAVDIETTLKTWGTGVNIVTRLVNQCGEECAAHFQKMVFDGVDKTTMNTVD